MQNKKPLLGIVGGLGAHASALLYTKILEMTDAACDLDYPQMLISSIGLPLFHTDAALCKDSAIELQSSILSLQQLGCTKVWVACNSVHVYKHSWWVEGICADWTYDFNHFIGNQSIVLASNSVRDAKFYNSIRPTSMFENNLIDSCINDVICGNHLKGDETRQSWKNLMNCTSNSSISLACTELSVLAEKFGTFGNHFHDSLNFIAQQICQKSKKPTS